MHTAFRRGTLFIAGILTAGTLHTAAGATPPATNEEREPVEFTFRFARADLDTQRGAERVFRALVARAGKACTMPWPGSPGLRYKDSQCVAGLVEKTVREIDAEVLTSQWQRHLPGPPSLQQPVTLR